MTALTSVSRLPFKDLNELQWQSLFAIEAANHLAPWSAQQLRDSVQAAYEAHAWLNQAQQVVAYSIFMPNVDEWELLNITVTSAAQGQGLGRSLLEQGLSAAKATGKSGVFLEVRPSNAPALGLYRALGFEHVGTRKGYYRTNKPQIQEDAWLMRLSLSLSSSTIV